MGSFIEINDTLQLTREQGFPAELDLEAHLEKPFSAEDFKDRVFEFRDKKDIRVYQQYPIRNFLAENHDGKWIYWGKCHIIEVTADYVNKTTSGKFKIIDIFSPEEMKQAERIINVDKIGYFS